MCANHRTTSPVALRSLPGAGGAFPAAEGRVLEEPRLGRAGGAGLRRPLGQGGAEGSEGSEGSEGRVGGLAGWGRWFLGPSANLAEGKVGHWGEV